MSSVPIGELIEYVIGGGWGSESKTEGTVPVAVIRGADFPDVALQNSSGLPRRFENSAAVGKRSLRSGDIVLEISGGTRERPTGRTVLVTDKMLRDLECEAIPASFCRLLRPKTELVESKWLYYVLQEWWNRGESWLYQNQSTGISNFRFKVFVDEVRFEVPDRSRQSSIAEFFGSLDDKIAANHAVASSSRALAETMMAGVTSSAKLGDLVEMVRKSIDPSSLDVKSVRHFSLPAFDAGAALEESPASIKSAKNLLEEAVVLVSKLNPRIPRIWAVDRLPTELALASTEFVALAPKDVGIGVLWGALLDPNFTQSMVERAGGTTGSHQRVKPEQMLDVDVRDVRELTTEKRSLLDSLCRKVNVVADENRLLAATRDELLPLLMSGKITVKDAEKAVEEVV